MFLSPCDDPSDDATLNSVWFDHDVGLLHPLHLLFFGHEFDFVIDFVIGFVINFVIGFVADFHINLI